MSIDLVQLRTFVTVAEDQHLTRASERLHISQSAASGHVRALEASLQTQLFVRIHRRMELTRAGQLLQRRAKILLNEAALFTSSAREIRGQLDGTLIVRANSEPAASRIGGVICALRAKHPMVTVDLRALPALTTQQALKTGEIDAGLLLACPVDSSFSYHQLASLRFRIAGPAAWKDRIESADWAELASLPWIAPTNRSLAHAAMLAELFTDRGLELNTVVHFDSIAQARAMLLSNVGMMLLREDHALRGEQEGRLAISPLASTEWPLFVVHLTSRGEDPMIRAFLEAVNTSWPDMRSITPTFLSTLPVGNGAEDIANKRDNYNPPLAPKS